MNRAQLEHVLRAAAAAGLIREGLVEPETLVARVRAVSGVGTGSVDRMEAWVRRQVGVSFG